MSTALAPRPPAEVPPSDDPSVTRLPWLPTRPMLRFLMALAQEPHERLSTIAHIAGVSTTSERYWRRTEPAYKAMFDSLRMSPGVAARFTLAWSAPAAASALRDAVTGSRPVTRSQTDAASLILRESRALSSSGGGIRELFERLLHETSARAKAAEVLPAEVRELDASGFGESPPDSGMQQTLSAEVRVLSE